MICSKCKAENPDTARFCNECGCHQKTPQSQFFNTFKNPKSYTPKFLAEKILTSKTTIEGERKNVTVLFADVAGYTPLSEKLDPETVHEIMEGCFKILLDQVHEHQGTINQFTGDGIMALFGAPLAIENHAQSACLAALAIQRHIEPYSQELSDRLGVNFKMRIGINSGTVVVGSIGDDLRMDYTAIGDTTNMAARMESMADPGKILISPNTFNLVYWFFDLKSRGNVRVKGKSDPMVVHELVKKRIDRSRLGKERQIYSEMVGRNMEISRLEIQVNKAIIGEGSVVNIIGDAGIGKSRLIAELKKREAMKQVTLLEGQAISIGKNLSFHPIINLLKQWAGITEYDSEARAFGKLDQTVRTIDADGADDILAFVATLMGLKPIGRYAKRVEGIEGEALEKLIVKNIRELMIKGSTYKPMVIIMEDLHWADTSSIELLENLYRLAEKNRLLFINVLRPGYLENRSDKITGIGQNLPVYYVEIKIQPLEKTDSEALIQNMLEISGLPYAVRSRIIDKAGGNPFFIEEVVRSLIDDGTIIKTGTGYQATDRIDKVAIPPTIHDVLIARIDRLEEQTRELVKVASVIGRSFFDRIIKDVAEFIEDVDDRLVYLKEIQLIRDRIRMQELEYLFKHALTQEAAYESTLLPQRKTLHLKVARSIEKLFQERMHEFYGMLAFHYGKAEDTDKAEEYMMKAGEEALLSSASSEALHYFQEALRLYFSKYGNDADPEKLVYFERNIALAFYNNAQWAEAVEYLDKVLERYGTPVPKRGLVAIVSLIRDLSVMLKVLYWRLPNSSKIPGDNDKKTLELFFKEAVSLQFIDPKRQFMAAIALFRRTLQFDLSKIPKLSGYWSGVSAVYAAGGLSFRLSNKLLGLAKRYRSEEDLWSRMSYDCMSNVIQTCQGTWGKIKVLNEDLLNSSLRIGDFWNVSAFLWSYGLVNAEKGEYEQVVKAIDKLNEIAKTYDWGEAISYGTELKVDFLLKTRKVHEAILVSDQGLPYMRENEDKFHEMMVLAFKAEAQQLTGDSQGASDSISQASNIFETQPFVVMPLFVVPYAAACFFVDVEQLKNAIHSKSSLEVLDLKKRAYHTGKTAIRNSRKYAPYRTKILRLMGLYYWLIGKQGKALNWWDKAIGEGERLGARPDLSRTYFEVGKRLLEPHSKYKELNGIGAISYIEKAETLFEKMESQYDLDELYRLTIK